MGKGLIAQVSITIAASKKKVWNALVSPEAIKQYMFGAEAISTWREGAAIVWKGRWKGKPYEDKGTIRRIEPESRLEYSHFSPLSGKPDLPENYHTVTTELTDEASHADAATLVSLSQDNNPDEQSREHAERNWGAMLNALKKYLEAG